MPAVPVSSGGSVSVAGAAPLSSTDIGAVRKLEDAIATVVRGKPEAIRAAVVTLLSRGHLLIEDIPGVGKTTLARALAGALGGTFRRIQFTSDLLPSDIVGVSVYDQHGKVFELRRGPIFANVVLADEINRTTPRTQSALLEAMSEGQVSIDDTTHTLDTPFLVLATQNPAEHYGTYPLPESQMDRFLLRIAIGYPNKLVERELLRERAGGDPVTRLGPVVDLATVRALQDGVETIRFDDALLDYAMTRPAGTPRSQSGSRPAAPWPGTAPPRPRRSPPAATSWSPTTSSCSPCPASRIAWCSRRPTTRSAGCAPTASG